MHEKGHDIRRQTKRAGQCTALQAMMTQSVKQDFGLPSSCAAPWTELAHTSCQTCTAEGNSESRPHDLIATGSCWGGYEHLLKHVHSTLLSGRCGQTFGQTLSAEALQGYRHV